MIKRLSRPVVLFAACLALAASAFSQGFVTYCNPRYGFCVDRPGGLTVKLDPDNGDGMVFHDTRGFELTASGSNNVLNHSLEAEMRSAGKNFEKIVYQAKRKNWFVLSGYSGSDVLYVKSYVGKGSINTLHILYPAEMKAKYDNITTIISTSFRPGDLNEAH